MNSALKDLSVVHRFCFATRMLPIGTPYYWKIVSSFGIQGKSGLKLLPEEARVFIKNLLLLNEEVFKSDICLIEELVRIPKCFDKIGMVLVSSVEDCVCCKSKLYIRSDRSTAAIVYEHDLGKLSAIHYTKYCRKTGCSLQQLYGYYSVDNKEVIYDNNALELPYFMCSRETGFSVSNLKRFDAECLLGQISYKQGAEIYNDYDTILTPCWHSVMSKFCLTFYSMYIYICTWNYVSLVTYLFLCT